MSNHTPVASAIPQSVQNDFFDLQSRIEELAETNAVLSVVVGAIFDRHEYDDTGRALHLIHKVQVDLHKQLNSTIKSLYKPLKKHHALLQEQPFEQCFFVETNLLGNITDYHTGDHYHSRSQVPHNAVELSYEDWLDCVNHIGLRKIDITTRKVIDCSHLASQHNPYSC